MFGAKKKDKDRRINKDNNAVTIPVYGPHDTLCAQDYKVPLMLSEFETVFEQRCKAWLRNAKPDMYNAGYMDILIDQFEKEAIVMIENQKIDHLSAIYELCKIWNGDKIKAEVKLEEVVLERQEVEKTLHLLERIYNKGTAYEELEYVMDTDKECDCNAQ